MKTKFSMQRAKILATQLVWEFIGSVFIAAGIYNFAVQAKFPMTGFSGISIILYRLLNIPIGFSTILLNIPLAIICYRLLGRKFCIQMTKKFLDRKGHFWDGLLSGLVNRLFYPLFVKATPFYVKDFCVGCGKCVSLCPLSNIRLEKEKPVWGSECTHCMACICSCPKEAIEYGKKSKGKPRYHCK